MAIDHLQFAFKVTDYTTQTKQFEELESGVLISGIYIEAAQWDTKKKLIVDSIPNQMFSSLPLIHFIPKEQVTLKGSIY